jgi:hypothetical protein
MKLKTILNLNETIKLSVGDIVYLDDIKLKIIDTRPLPFNPPRSINVDTGNEFTLTMRDLKNLSKRQPKLIAADVERKFRDWVLDTVGERPNQSFSLIDFINSKKSTDTIRLSFMEEVKDGRAPKFDVNGILKLKRNTFSIPSVNITIKNITYLNVDINDVRGSSYQTHNYKLTVTK